MKPPSYELVRRWARLLYCAYALFIGVTSLAMVLGLVGHVSSWVVFGPALPVLATLWATELWKFERIRRGLRV